MRLESTLSGVGFQHRKLCVEDDRHYVQHEEPEAYDDQATLRLCREELQAKAVENGDAQLKHFRHARRIRI